MNKKYKILAIDDEQVILGSIVKLCSAEGWQVDEVIDAKVGIKKLNEHAYKLIISDIMMPDMDGFEFLDYLRKNEIRTPVIITTGFSTIENAVKSLYSGAIDFLPKPFTYDELISCVARGLRYSEIQELANISCCDSDSFDSSMAFIPSPPRYKRLGYSSWAYLEDDGSVKIGLTDLFLRTIEAIEEIDLLNVEDEIIQGTACYQITTKDQLIHNVLSPISGHIIHRNEQVLNNHTIVEKDPYFKGWIYTVVPANLDYEAKYLVPCSSDRI